MDEDVLSYNYGFRSHANRHSFLSKHLANIHFLIFGLNQLQPFTVILQKYKLENVKQITADKVPTTDE